MPKILATIDSWFGHVVDILNAVLFFDIKGFPLIVVVLMTGAIVFTFAMRFINFRGFRHSVDVIRGKYDDPNDPGQISHFQALTSALSATIGLGNIAGVAVAVARGGPGAVFWMVTIALFGMTAKFVSCTLAQLYRKIDDQGEVRGGPMYYLSMGLAERGKPGLGKVLAVIYAVFIIGGAFGGGSMFQANQSYELVSEQVPLLQNLSWFYGLVMIGLVAAVIIGKITRIGAATSKIVPLMCVIYVGASLFIIFSNLGEIPGVFVSIFSEAFNPDAIYGGLLGVMVLGIRRAVFSNEAGVGSAAIVHSAAKTDEPVREGIVAMIGPFIDTVVICLMTASVLLITAGKNELYQEYREARSEVVVAQQALDNASAENQASAAAHLEEITALRDSKERGATLTSAAFATVIDWFPLLLTLVVFLFSYSTMISWYYYGEKGWEYLFGMKLVAVYQVMFMGAIFLGSVATLGNVLDFSDLMILSCAFPNIIGAMFLLPVVRKHLNDYWTRYKAGEMKVHF